MSSEKLKGVKLLGYFIIMGIIGILLSSISMANGSGAPSYADIKNIDLISENELYSSLKVKPLFLNKIDEVQYDEHIAQDTYAILDNEKCYINMTEDEFDEYFSKNALALDTDNTNEYYINTVGKRLAAGLYRLNRIETDEDGNVLINNNTEILVTKSVFNTKQLAFSTDTSKTTYKNIYTSKVIVRESHDEYGEIIANIHIIRDINNNLESIFLEEMSEFEIYTHTYTNDEIQLKIHETDVVDQSINKIVYKIPMEEFTQYLGNIQLPMCSSACMSSVLTAYRDAYIQPYLFNRTVFPVSYDKLNNIDITKFSKEQIEDLKAYDPDIQYRDYTGISAYAVSDMLKDTITKVTIHSLPYPGYISKYIQDIRNDKICLLSLIKYGDRSGVKVSSSGGKINVPTHVTVLNGYIDSDILIGFNTTGVNSDGRRVQKFMIWLNKSVSNYMTYASLYFTGLNETKLYSVNDVIELSDPINSTQNKVKKQYTDLLYNLGEMIDTEYEYYKAKDKNYIHDFKEMKMREQDTSLWNTIEEMNKEAAKNYVPTEAELKHIEQLEKYTNECKRVANELFSSESVAKTLGITEEQLNKLTSGYTPYSMSRVAEFNKNHQEALILALLIRDTESYTINSGNEKQTIRPELFSSDIAIVFDDSKVDLDKSDNFMQKYLKIRKHDTKIVTKSLTNIYNVVNETDLFGNKSNYVVTVFGNDNGNTKDRRVGVILNMSKQKNTTGTTIYKVSMAVPKTDVITNETNTYTNIVWTSENVPIVVNYISGELYDIVELQLSTIAAFAIPYGGIEIWPLDSVFSTPVSVDSSIRNNLYYSSGGQSKLIDLSK